MTPLAARRAVLRELSSVNIRVTVAAALPRRATDAAFGVVSRLDRRVTAFAGSDSMRPRQAEASPKPMLEHVARIGETGLVVAFRAASLTRPRARRYWRIERTIVNIAMALCTRGLRCSQ